MTRIARLYLLAVTLMILATAAVAQPPEPEEPQITEMDLIQQIQANLSNPRQVAQLAEQFIAEFPDSENIAFIRFQATLAYQGLNNFEKMLEHGKATLALLPDHPVILVTLAYGYAENQQPDEADKLAKKGLQSLDALAEQGQVPMEQINQMRCTLHAALGYVHLQRALKIDREKDKKKRANELKQAVTEFQAALKDNDHDEISYYRLGQTYALMEEVESCLKAYACTVALNGALAERARADMMELLNKLEEANQLDGRTLEKYVAQAKQGLGL